VPRLSPALDRIPPQAVEAEQHLLGQHFTHPAGSVLEAMRAALQPSDFYRAGNQAAVKILYQMADRGVETHVVNFCDEAEKAGQLDFIGGRDHIHGWLKTAALPSSVDGSIRLVKDAAACRALIDLGGKLVGMGYEREADASTLIRHAVEMLAGADTRYASSNGSRLDTFTAADLQGMEFEALRWAVEGIFPEGLCLLVGRSKVGKSFLIHAVAGAVATGGKVLSHIDVEAGEVLYFALEDPRRRLQDRHRRLMLDGSWPTALHFATQSPTLEEGILNDIDAWLRAHPAARLVIIDTLARVRGAVHDSGGVYWNETEVMGRIQSLALQHAVCIVLTHHENKMQSPGDRLDAISGSTGIVGPADAVVQLQRVRGEEEAVLAVTGREIKDARYRIAWTDSGGWRWVGDEETIVATEAEQEIANVMRLALYDAERKGWMTPSEVAGSFKPARNRGTIGKHMARMAEKGHLLRHADRGTYRIASGTEPPE
jgi:AAA domain-containing protein/DnaB helicase-like protein